MANLTEAKNSKDDFDYMVEQGYSITNPYIEEYANNVRIYLEKANSFFVDTIFGLCCRGCSDCVCFRIF